MTSDAGEIPTIDLGDYLKGSDQDKERIAAEVDEICQTTGFLVVDNHGVPAKIVERAWSSARSFFDLPLDQKLKLHASDPNCPRGYFPFAQEALERTQGVDSAPDRKEAFSSGPLVAPSGHAPTPGFDFFYGNNAWPDGLTEFREAWIAYYQAMETLGAQVMQLLACALRLKEDFFVPFHQHHLGALRALNYPASKAAENTAQHRAGAHADYGTVTILKPDPQVGGLEIQLPSAKWIAAPIVTDSFLVNLGDLMARWTNDRWISTVHRVANGSADGESPRRQSIAYFMNPNYDAEITVLPTCLETDEKP
ncbi:MAG: isopenicillin N synthase family dioxygenase, partial [Woeseiaceae bacterium]